MSVSPLGDKFSAGPAYTWWVFWWHVVLFSLALLQPGGHSVGYVDPLKRCTHKRCDIRVPTVILELKVVQGLSTFVDSKKQLPVVLVTKAETFMNRRGVKRW